MRQAHPANGSDLFLREPIACFLEHERSVSGMVVPVATILLQNRRCPWRCIYCDLWKSALDFTLPAGVIPAQIEFALDSLIAQQPVQPRQLKLYNAGSFFDRAAIRPADFPAIAQSARRFERVVVESHPALIGNAALLFRDLIAPAQLEVAMGLEIADDVILRRMNKRMTLASFSRAAAFLQQHGIALRAFIMVKPPWVRTEEEALEFASRSVQFAFDCGATVVSLIPARFGPEELDRLAVTGDFSPPRLRTLEAAQADGIAVQRGRVFADLWDLEQFADCERCFTSRTHRLDQMNLRQIVLPPIACDVCSAPVEQKSRASLETRRVK